MDTSTGQIIIDDVAIGPATTAQELQRSVLGAEMKPQPQAVPPWEGYTLTKPHLIGAAPFLVSLMFKGGRLESILLYMPQDGDSGSWDDWSEKKERARKKSHDRWLKTLLGSPPYEYPWGTVTSSFDPRSASSSIVISYRAPGE